jgi:hypothetical protein
LSFFDFVLVVVGTAGVLGGLWPLLTGRNFPGVLGRGFTQGDNLRLKRAPAIYFRAMGATIATFGLFVLYVGAILWLSAGLPTAAFGFVGTFIAISCFASLAWLLWLTYRYKLFRWNAP